MDYVELMREHGVTALIVLAIIIFLFWGKIKSLFKKKPKQEEQPYVFSAPEFQFDSYEAQKEKLDKEIKEIDMHGTELSKRIKLLDEEFKNEKAKREREFMIQKNELVAEFEMLKKTQLIKLKQVEGVKDLINLNKEVK